LQNLYCYTPARAARNSARAARTFGKVYKSDNQLL